MEGKIGKAGDVDVYAEAGCEEFARLRLKMLRAENRGASLKPGILAGLKRLPGGRAGFAGSGSSRWEWNGVNYTEDRGANGRGFWGTTMWIGKERVAV
jgi:hypothetical protein